MEKRKNTKETFREERRPLDWGEFNDADIGMEGNDAGGAFHDSRFSAWDDDWRATGREQDRRLKHLIMNANYGREETDRFDERDFLRSEDDFDLPFAENAAFAQRSRREKRSRT